MIDKPRPSYSIGNYKPKYRELSHRHYNQTKHVDLTSNEPRNEEMNRTTKGESMGVMDKLLNTHEPAKSKPDINSLSFFFFQKLSFIVLSFCK